MKQNPYQTQPGFGLRVYRAKTALENYGRNYSHSPYSRSFDSCFENFDGNAVVWTLMYDAIENKNEYLAEGIRRTGEKVWPHWLEVYEQRGKYAPAAMQLNISFPQPKPVKTLKPSI